MTALLSWASVMKPRFTAILPNLSWIPFCFSCSCMTFCACSTVSSFFETSQEASFIFFFAIAFPIGTARE